MKMNIRLNDRAQLFGNQILKEKNSEFRNNTFISFFIKILKKLN